MSDATTARPMILTGRFLGSVSVSPNGWKRRDPVGWGVATKGGSLSVQAERADSASAGFNPLPDAQAQRLAVGRDRQGRRRRRSCVGRGPSQGGPHIEVVRKHSRTGRCTTSGAVTLPDNDAEDRPRRRVPRRFQPTPCGRFRGCSGGRRAGAAARCFCRRRGLPARPLFNAASTRQISARRRGASPSVAPSSRSRRGLVISARLIASICCRLPTRGRQAGPTARAGSTPSEYMFSE